jgi:hypothetical protein
LLGISYRRDGLGGYSAWGDYDRSGGRMHEEDGGDMGHVVMVLSGGGRYEVLSWPCLPA